jgi:hypothetical protein
MRVGPSALRRTPSEVHPEFSELKFSDGGPKASFAIIRRLG